MKVFIVKYRFLFLALILLALALIPSGIFTVSAAEGGDNIEFNLFEIIDEISEEFVAETTGLIESNWDENYFSTIIITCGETQMFVDGSQETLSSPVVIEDGEVMLPLADIAAAVGAEVEIDEITGDITIMEGQYMTMPPLVSAAEAEEALDLDIHRHGEEITITKPYQLKQIIVYVKDGQGLKDNYGAEQYTTDDQGLYFLQYPSEKLTQDAYEAFLTDPQIAYATVNHLVYLTALPERWGSVRIAADRFKNYLVNSNKTSSNLIVAVVDSGIDSNHTHLRGRTVNGYNFASYNTNTSDGVGHGTHVSGTIVDCTPDNVKIMPVKIMNDSRGATEFTISLAIRYAADNGAAVMNMSFGGPCTSNNCLIKSAVDYAVNRGVAAVASAGNNSGNAAGICPANLANVITVSAFDNRDKPASFTNYGAAIDVGAPGVSILSSVPGGGYAYYSGTSMAAPHVTAAVAMLKLDNRNATPAQLKTAVRNTAVPVSGLSSIYYGAGLLDFNKYFASNPVDFTVTYNFSENGGATASKTSATVAQGAAIDLSPTATKANWNFVGWNTNKDATTHLTALNMGTANVTLYAIYSKTLKGSFIDYSGNAQQTRQAQVTIYNKDTGGNILTPFQNTYTGWTQRGWGTASTANASVAAGSNSSYLISADTDFYGLYSRTITLSYNANGGSAAPPSQGGTQYTNSHNITLFGNPSFTLAGPATYAGYTFDSWALGSAGGAKYPANSSITIADNTTMFATWSGGLTDTVNWSLTAGTVNSKSGSINIVKQADRYQFSAPVSGTYTFFSSNKAATLYYLDATLSNSAGSPLVALLDYGYGFNFTYSLTAGQTYNLDLLGYYGTGAYTVNITVPAAAGNYTVTYNFSENGGASASKTIDTLNQGAAIDLAPRANKADWIFVGWNTNKDATAGLSSLTMGQADVTLYAIYSRVLSALFIDYNAISQYARIANVTIYNKASEGYVLAPAQNNYVGWTARGWSTSTTADAAVVCNPGVYHAISQATIFYGLYSRTLTLSYNANGGASTPNSQSGLQYTNSCSITTYANPSFTLAGPITRPGYAFDGWALGGSSGQKYPGGSSITINADTTMYASWGSGILP
jgi:thermitase